MIKKQQHRISVFAFLALAGALLVACGSDDDPAAAAAASPSGGNAAPGGNAPPSSGNSAPRITGTPSTSVLQGTTYLFVPTASDSEGNPLTFSIVNSPPWATFNSSTGRLSGTPTAAQVGMYNNITISVNDGSASASLATFSIQVVATATGSATLSWNPPTQNTDGSPLNNLAGYRIYWGRAAGSYASSVTINNPGLSTYVVDQLTPAQWFFVVTAVSSAGVESGYSNIASKTVQ